MKWLTPFAATLFLVSFTASSSDLINALQECKQVENSLARLQCFDKASQTLPPYPAPSSDKLATHSEPEKPKQEVAKFSESDFGLEHKKNLGELAETILATIATIQKDAHKKLIFTFENGQVWKQTDSDRFRAKQGDKVLVKRGLLNSFYLSKANSNKRIRVTRVK
ncbi:hypothetical protein [Paraglaciecola sp. 2405UD69-4]|uniref:hypothetical protein n=1 Tax=Paraglaciecola sp. 2405UD69-4 TaxID=3391836 RepID=UPI0039C8DBD0